MSDNRSPETSPSQPIIIRENIDSLSASLSDQIEMLAAELRSRWKSGHGVGVEQLGSAFEQVAKNEEQLLDLIYHEVLIREEFGEKPSLDDFAARFPQYVERLQRLFAVHGAIEDDDWEDELESAFADDAAAIKRDESDAQNAPSSTDVGESADRKKSHWPRKPRDSRPVEPPPGYELLEEIGRGGMAVVFRAKQQILNRVVALKMLLAGGVASKEVLARVQQEARAVAQLQHPGIVQIHEVGEHRGLPYLSLEYVAGGTLHEWLGGRPLPPLEAARIIEQLARTTHYAHEHGVVHRDLKPANVLLSGEWGVRSEEEKGPLQREEPDDDSKLSRTQGLAKGDGPGSRLLRSHETISEGGVVRTDEPDSPGGILGPGKHRGGAGAAAHEGIPQFHQHRTRIVEGTGNASDSKPTSGAAAGRNPSGTTPSNRGGQPNARGTANVNRSSVSGEGGAEWGKQLSPRVPLPTPHSSLPTLKISDFGLARVLGSRSDLTATGQVIGTPSYMAPEQAAGTVDDVSPAQDIYSLGAILYELLTGRPPFRGSSLFDTLEQVRTTEAVPPRQLQPRVPRDLETICLKCLEKSPDRRYPTAAALAEDLQRVQDGNTITARPAGSFERSWKWVRRYPAIASLVLLTFLLTIVGAFGILREARRANLSERSAKLESQRAEQLHKLADRERDDAKLQRRLAEESQKKTEHSAEVALRERRIAEQQRLIADTERTRAQEAQTQAEASLEETMQAINSLAVLGASLRNQPGQQALSKRLYDDTLLMYENLAMRKGDNPAIRRQRIMALINAGDIHRTLRNTEQSEQLLLQAAQLIEEELKYDPNNAELNLLAHGPYWHLGVLYKDTGRTTESLEHFRKDVLALENVLKTKAGDLNNMTRLANSLTNECVALRQLGRNVEAAERYEKSIALLRAVLKALPSHLAASSELGMALQDYSLLLRSLRRFDDSKAAFQESFELRLKAYQQAPKASYTRTFLSRMYVSQGYFDRIEKKHESSLEQFQKAIDLLVPSVDEYPDLYEHQKDLLVAMAEHLVSCLETRNAEIGKPAWQRFSNRLQVTLQKFPKDKSVVDLAANWQYHWADQLWEDNQRPQAVALLKSALPASTLLPTLTSPLTPQDEARLSNNAAWRLAVVAEPSLRATKKSVELARRATELVPDNSNYVQSLGTALYFDGDYAAAREQLLKAIQLEQAASKRGTLDQLLEALKTLPKDPAAARKEFDASLGLQNSSPHAMSLYYSMLSMTLWKLDDQATARDTLRLVVDPPADFSTDGPETRRLIAEARALVRSE